MFRIRRIYDDILPVNRDAIRQVQEMLRAHFAGVRPAEIDGLPQKLRNPLHHGFRTVLYVADDLRGRVLGLAVVLHEPEIHFCLLEFIASAQKLTGRGVGGALYQRVRSEARLMRCKALLFECLPDDRDKCPDAEIRKQNAARLRFYEAYGARPVDGTEYDTPVRPEETGYPYLVYDGLDHDRPFRRDFARKVVRAILERKYGHLCPPEYVEKVVKSFRDDPVQLRPPRYVKKETTRAPLAVVPTLEPIGLVVNDRHQIHHVRERGYVESPVRIRSILEEIEPSGMFERIPVREYPEKRIKQVHDSEFVEYLRRACAEVPEGKSVYPYVFPIRNAARPPKERSLRAGYYCIDTFTPLNRNAFLAAKRAVDCSLTAADEILGGRRFAYALVRPPGHHAERRVFGGFCYFCNSAIAAHHLSAHGKVAILDIDYHHGNGQQDIFYERGDVLTVSIHGHPKIAYPYFSGFSEERGDGAGEGFNLNIPLPETQNGEQYRKALARAIKAVQRFAPVFLVVAFGLDPAKGDPTGSWLLTAKDFEANGRLIGGMGLPTLVVQEGGYRTRTLGTNARSFFKGFLEGAQSS